MLSKISSSYLLVKGCAGIGNRIFTLAAAIRYAEKNNRIIIVDWRDGVFSEKGKNAFDLFFEITDFPSESLSLVEKQDFTDTIYPAVSNGQLNENLYDLFCFCRTRFERYVKFSDRLIGKWSRLNSFWYYHPGNNFGKEMEIGFSVFRVLNQKHHFELGHKLKDGLGEKLVLFADYWPGRVSKKYFQFIRLKSSFVSEVELIQKNLGVTNETIGIHIRATDKQPGKSLERLISFLKSRNKPDAVYFLATDNPEVERVFLNSFGNSLITLKKNYLSADGNENLHHYGIRTGNYGYTEQIFFETLVDLYLLTKCGVFYFQGNSSFSRLACIWRGNDEDCFDWLKIE